MSDKKYDFSDKEPEDLKYQIEITCEYEVLSEKDIWFAEFKSSPNCFYTQYLYGYGNTPNEAYKMLVTVVQDLSNSFINLESEKDLNKEAKIIRQKLMQLWKLV